jgi:hypothetical protein
LRSDERRPFAFECCSSCGYCSVYVSLPGDVDIVCYESLVVWAVDAESLARFGVDVLTYGEENTGMLRISKYLIVDE